MGIEPTCQLVTGTAVLKTERGTSTRHAPVAGYYLLGRGATRICEARPCPCFERHRRSADAHACASPRRATDDHGWHLPAGRGDSKHPLFWPGTHPRDDD